MGSAPAFSTTRDTVAFEPATACVGATSNGVTGSAAARDPIPPLSQITHQMHRARFAPILESVLKT